MAIATRLCQNRRSAPFGARVAPVRAVRVRRGSRTRVHETGHDLRAFRHGQGSATTPPKPRVKPAATFGRGRILVVNDHHFVNVFNRRLDPVAV